MLQHAILSWSRSSFNSLPSVSLNGFLLKQRSISHEVSQRQVPDISQHQMGVQASPNDRIPEFHAQTLPAGTAPKDRTFQPNPDLNNQGMYQDASTTLGGATSKDVHTGLGHPGQGMTSTEERHDGMHGRKKQGLGTAGLAEHYDNSDNKDMRPAYGYDSNPKDDDLPPAIRR